MKIDRYSFGKLDLDGKSYESDIIIYPDKVDSSWWRKEGHYLRIEDVKDVIKEKLDVIIIGTGYYGAMTVPKETIDYLKKNNFQVFVEKTPEAVRLFNDISVKDADKGIVAMFHLTC